MQPSLDAPPQNKGKWIYAELTVRDGNRILKPSHVGGNRVRFDEPPRLTSREIEIVLTVGQAVQRHFAIVLPHQPDDASIPIELGPPLQDKLATIEQER